MRCVICKLGETETGTTTLTFVREFPGLSKDVTIVLKHVPAQVCANCGEAYVDEPISAEAMRLAEDATQAGSLVEVRDFNSPAVAQ